MRSSYSPNTFQQLANILNQAQANGNSVYFSTANGNAYVIQNICNNKICCSYVGTQNKKELSWDEFKKLIIEFWEDIKE